jgi:hypothetical protein
MLNPLRLTCGDAFRRYESPDPADDATVDECASMTEPKILRLVRREICDAMKLAALRFSETYTHRRIEPLSNLTHAGIVSLDELLEGSYIEIENSGGRLRRATDVVADRSTVGIDDAEHIQREGRMIHTE